MTTKKDLMRENTVLREALRRAMVGLVDIPRSRLEKEQQYPHQDPEQGLTYATCAMESLHRGRDLHGAILDYMAEEGAL